MEYSAGVPCSYKFTVQTVPRTNSLLELGIEPPQAEISRIKGRNKDFTDKGYYGKRSQCKTKTGTEKKWDWLKK